MSLKYVFARNTYAWGGGARAAASLCLVAGCKGAAKGAVVNELAPVQYSSFNFYPLIVSVRSICIVLTLTKVINTNII